MCATRNFELQDGFREAREFFQSEYDNPNQAYSDCRGLFSRDTAYALFEDGRPDNSFTVNIQDKLIGIIFNAGQYEYNSISRKIDQSPEDVELIRRHLGRYCYWRYNIQGKLVSGEISVIESSGMFLFEHYNNITYDRGVDEFDPDHDGYVFALKNRLHFHGMGPKYIRPIIANVVESPANDYVDGIVMTVQRSTLALMAARFIMIHEDHNEFSLTESSIGYERFSRKMISRIEKGNSVKGVLITSDE